MAKTEKVEQKETRAERLDRLMRKAVPGLKEGQEWGPTGAPYVFSDLSDGRQRLTIENPETGERLGFVGSDRDDLLNQLDERVKGRG